jgi:hypothetical protein
MPELSTGSLSRPRLGEEVDPSQPERQGEGLVTRLPGMVE